MPSRCAQGEWGWVPTYVNTIPHDLFCWLSLGFFERPCQSECLTGVVEILRRSPIRAGMGVLRDIALALYATYQRCKTRGICHRSLLGLLMEIPRRDFPIWAGMGVLQDIAFALYATYQPCKARRIHRRSLLGLLLEINAGHYLEVSARKSVEMEVASRSQVGSHFSHSTLGCLTRVTSRLCVHQVARQGHVPRKFPKS